MVHGEETGEEGNEPPSEQELVTRFSSTYLSVARFLRAAYQLLSSSGFFLIAALYCCKVRTANLLRIFGIKRPDGVSSLIPA